MSDFAFTKGPWFVGQTPYQRDNHPEQRSIGLSLEEDGGVSGYRLHPNKDDGSYLNISGYCSEADGRLIAAATALAEALRALQLQALQSPELLRTAYGQEAIAGARAALALLDPTPANEVAL